MPGRFLDWGVAAATRTGESVSGDRFLVHRTGTRILLAVVDGTGHGPGAAQAAEVAMALLELNAAEPPAELLRQCHRGLAGTRGAAILAAGYDTREATLAWAGVGDAFGVLARADARARPGREALLPRGGILGVTLPPLGASLLAVRDGDLLVLATDGVRDDFTDEARPGDEPSRVAARILERHGRGHDDALVLAVRFRVEPR